MKAHRKQKLTLILLGLLAVGIIVGLVTFALSSKIDLYFSPGDINEAPLNTTLRLGGMVKEGSVVRSEDSLDVSFGVYDYLSEVTVEYNGILPDLFKENQSVVATGKMTDRGVFVAEEILAKHDENYIPKEVADALEKQGHPGGINNSKSVLSYD